MKKRLIMAGMLFCIAVIAAAIACTFLPHNGGGSTGALLVDFNEVMQLSQQNGARPQKEYDETAAAFRKELKNGAAKENDTQAETAMWIMCAFCLLFICGALLYVYFKILRPFDKLKAYALEIAKGNLDVHLDYERQNFFGEFTWAFSSMREEIIKSRACEQEAINNNKTVVATLSHDIKTPIASLRMYAESLGAEIGRSPEQRKKYIDVILRKCDEVTRLTNDLFLHSLSALDKLQIVCERAELAPLLSECVSNLTADDDKIRLHCNADNRFVNIDRKRFGQVIENLIGNAAKYAPKSKIDVSCGIEDGSAAIRIRDYGGGILDKDMPFIFEKFYRGKNAGDAPGSGLGLYIVKYIMEQMGGEVHLFNHKDGLEAVLNLPLEFGESKTGWLAKKS